MARPRAFFLQGQEGSSVAEAAPAPEKRTRGFVRDNGLTIALAGAVAVSVGLMLLAGWTAFNEDLARHGRPAVGLVAYAGSGDFLSALFENWESEFLQMGMYVVLTAYLYQKGSSESKPLDRPSPQDADPRDSQDHADAPWPVRHGGLVLKLYESSLSGLFFLLFAGSLILHAAGGAAAYSAEQSAHGGAPVTFWEYLGTSQFWFESMQNWQSEFLAIAVMVGASVYLRQRGSAESKPVAEPHHATGT
jgi:hypothetical protein